MRREKDYINFHVFLNMIREDRDISLEKLRYGLCTKTMMHKIDIGEVLPEYQLRNRFIARMGISSERYEDYIQYDEYQRWKLSQDVIRAVEAEDSAKAEAMLQELQKLPYVEKKLERQFELDMEARIKELNGCSYAEITKLYEQAIAMTMPRIDYQKLDKYAFAPEEYYLILRYFLAESKQDNDIYKIQSISMSVDSVIKHIKKSLLTNDMKAKVMPMAVYVYYELIKDLVAGDIQACNRMINRIDEAIECLRDAQRTYYLLELLDAKVDLYEKSGKGIGQYENYEIEQEGWKKSIIRVRELYSSGIDINYSGYIYDNSEIFCICDVVRSRRKMFGLTISELVEGICSERSLIRLENGQSKMHLHECMLILERLGVGTNYKRSEIYVSDIDTLNLFTEYKMVRNDGNNEKGKEIRDKLLKRLKHDSLSNRQLLARLINLANYENGDITKDQYIHNMELTLKMSMPKTITAINLGYLTNSELLILFHIYLRDNQNSYRQILELICNRYENQGIRNHLRVYTLIMGAMASNAGNCCQYDYSNEKSMILIKQSSNIFRLQPVHRNCFNIVWNEAMVDGNIFAPEKRDGLVVCEKVSNFCKSFKMEKFYNNAIKYFDNKQDWR